ncbi:MAG: pseudouridylate synthase [Saprospiraceae bacterium]
MNASPIFNFKTDLSEVPIPTKLNNPFGSEIPVIAKIAAQEFQTFITSEAEKWQYNFHTQKGKMLGVLVVQKSDQTYAYLGAVSGKLPNNAQSKQLVPSVFDDAADDFFINKGMTELTALSRQINNTTDPTQIITLKEKRKQKSISLQRQLFENYRFSNLSGQEAHLLDIFQRATNGTPPSAAGECAAPKLLQYAIKNQLKPIALTEFWWGNPSKNNDRTHKVFYPACKEKCRPILEYMLEDANLFDERFLTKK